MAHSPPTSYSLLLTSSYFLQVQLRDVKPFDKHDDFSDSYLIDAVRDCEGNHLSFPVPPIEVTPKGT